MLSDRPRPQYPAVSQQRDRILFDTDWRFALGHASDPVRDFGHATGFFSYLAKTGYGDGAAAPGFDDEGWRLVNLPHDFAIELPFDPRASASHGYRAVGPRFPENSVGWYRKRFCVPAGDLGRRIRLELDGAFRAARVFVNGFFVGEEPSGTLGASYDISDYLDYGGENVVAVRVDASMEEGWYYEGAGIYRHVWLTKTSPLHVARYGSWVRTSLDPRGHDAR
jgi:beta-galactosidase